MREKKVYYMALSDGYRQTNTMTNKVDLVSLKNISKKSEVKEKLEDLVKKGIHEASIWGVGIDKKSTYEKMENDDIVFFTYKETIVYIGTIIGKFEEVELSEYLWSKRGEWPFKVIVDNVIQVFIPGRKTDYEHLKINFPEVQEKKVEIAVEMIKNDFDARYILNINNNGNMQGIIAVNNCSYDQVLTRLSSYCLRTNFECLIKKV